MTNKDHSHHAQPTNDGVSRSMSDTKKTADREKSLGQSLVEFALVLPVMLLLMLTALDFGRVYLGYINLQNMARIAANFAADNPSAWDGVVKGTDAELKDKYFN